MRGGWRGAGHAAGHAGVFADWARAEPLGGACSATVAVGPGRSRQRRESQVGLVARRRGWEPLGRGGGGGDGGGGGGARAGVREGAAAGWENGGRHVVGAAGWGQVHP